MKTIYWQYHIWQKIKIASHFILYHALPTPASSNVRFWKVVKLNPKVARVSTISCSISTSNNKQQLRFFFFCIMLLGGNGTIQYLVPFSLQLLRKLNHFWSLGVVKNDNKWQPQRYAIAELDCVVRWAWAVNWQKRKKGTWFTWN